MMKSIRNDIIDLFTCSQKTAAVHQRNALILRNLYHSCGTDEFLEVLKAVMNTIMITRKSTPYFEKIMNFFGLFCSLLKPENNEISDTTVELAEHPLLTEILSYLLEASESINDVIRIRSCQLINRILDNLVGVEVSEELCENLEKTLLIRLQDPKSAVRQQAVISLHRLQVPSDPNDQIMLGFIDLMNCDSFAKVRQLCVDKIAATKKIIAHILLRTRDVDPNVRLSAFKRLSTFAGSLKISEKRQILQCGFLDGSGKVKEFVNTVLIKSWLEHYHGNILAFMKSLRLDADERDVENTVFLFENVLPIIFRDKQLTELTAVLPLNEKRLVSVEDLNWEVVSYWRIYVQFLKQNEEFEEEFDRVIPELIYVCKYIKEYYVGAPTEITAIEFVEHQFILKQLFLITMTYDFADPTNRNCLNSLVTNILENVMLTSDVINVIIRTLEHSIPGSEKRTQFITEMISEILYPINSEEALQKTQEEEFQIAQITVNLNRLRVCLEEAIQGENFIEANRIKKEIEELNARMTHVKTKEPAQPHEIEKKTDLVTTIKCLDIAAATLSSPKINRLTTHLKALKEDFIQELLIHDNDTISAKAMKTYGLCCIVNKETAATGIHIFSTPIFAYQKGEECDTQTLLVCISAVVDLLRVYGSQLMAAPETEDLSESMEEKQQAVFMGGTSLTDILQGLVDLMDDEQYEIQEKAGLGLCQLILSDRIISPSLICRLVLKWCNPADDDESQRLRQIIGYTLQQMPSMKQCTEQLADAILMTIRTLFSAPDTSPLADVNIENITKFMIALCKTSPDAHYIFSSLATTICKDIVKKPRSNQNVLLTKTLLMLEIPDQTNILNELLHLCDEIRDNTSDKNVINNVMKFLTILSKKRPDGVVEQNVIERASSESENAEEFEADIDD